MANLHSLCSYHNQCTSFSINIKIIVCFNRTVCSSSYIGYILSNYVALLSIHRVIYSNRYRVSENLWQREKKKVFHYTMAMINIVLTVHRNRKSKFSAKFFFAFSWNRIKNIYVVKNQLCALRSTCTGKIFFLQLPSKTGFRAKVIIKTCH